MHTPPPFVTAFGLLISQLLWYSPVDATLISSATASIDQTNEYLGQVVCVQRCIWEHGGYDDVVDYIGCGSPYLNGCICQAALSLSASSFLSSCVVANCTSAPEEVVSAVSVYSAYCAGSATVAAQTTTASVQLTGQGNF